MSDDCTNKRFYDDPSTIWKRGTNTVLKRHHGFQSGLLYSFNFFKVKAVCGSGNADDIQFIHIPRGGSGYGRLTQGLGYGSGIKFPSNVSRSGLYKVNTYWCKTNKTLYFS